MRILQHTVGVVIVVGALAACTTTRYITEPILPPSSLYHTSCVGSLSDRAGEINTNGQLRSYTLDLIEALRACQADREALKDWALESVR